MEPVQAADETEFGPARRLAALFGATVSIIGIALLLLVPSASASLERVGGFIESGNFQLAVPSGIAVNTTGNGGVPVGTIYTVDEGEVPLEPYSGVVSYDSKGEFRVAWGWGVGNKAEEFQRCGPAGDPAFPTCPSTNFGRPGEGVGQISSPKGVAVDQATGNVYVYNFGRAKGVVQIFTAQGVPIGSFGENAPSQSIAESPEKVHSVGFFKNMIAVDSTGDVYLSDLSVKAGGEASRVMVFSPGSPGNVEHYAYAGRSHDIDVTTSTTANSPESLAVDSSGNVYAASAEFIREFSPSEPVTPTCEFKPPGGQVGGMTVNANRDEVFYLSKTNEKFHQIACGAAGKFVEKSSFLLPAGRTAGGVLAFDPVLAHDQSRPAGFLYYASKLRGVDIFAPGEIRPPRVESESASKVAVTSAALEAEINPEGPQTKYHFQYLPQAEYEANAPDAAQSLTVSATGGVFNLGYEGNQYGGEATASLNTGSTVATELKTAVATATLKGASGTASLKAAKGGGTLIAGSPVVTSLTTSEGSFEVGQTITGAGIPQNTTIKTVAVGELTLSSPAVTSAAGAPLAAGSTILSSLSTTEGNFEVGETVSGEGIPAGAEVTSVKAGQLTISAPATKSGAGIPIQAGSKVLTSVVVSKGRFEVGQTVEGTGIPTGTKVVRVEVGKLTLSSAITVAGTGVAITSVGPGPFAVGQTIEGVGLSPGTTIVAAKAGELTLSKPASSAGTVVVRSGIAFDADAAEVQEGLEALPGIGAGNVDVSGGPGDEGGSSPYVIRFGGALANTEISAPIEADETGLSGGAASATVEVENAGGGGFDGSEEAPVGEATLGAGKEALSAGTTLRNLAADSTYFYRVVAVSFCNPEEEKEKCESVGQPRSFRTFPSEGGEKLPDNRAYELVSPVSKAGGEVLLLNPRQVEPPQGGCIECNRTEFSVFPKESSPDGAAVVYEGTPFAAVGGAVRENEYISRRTSSGWITTNLTPERLESSGEAGFKAFDSELGKGLLAAESPSLTPSAPSEYANLYGLSSTGPSDLEPVIRREGERSAPEFSIVYAGATPDLSHVLFEANDSLTRETEFAPEPSGNAEQTNLYESVNGELRLVNVLPGDTEAAPGATFGSGTILNGGGNVGYAFDDAISANGERIFWSSDAGQVYVREEGRRTVEIPDHNGKFLTASADGSEVLLSDGTLYNLETKTEVPLAEGKGGFKGVVGRSENLSSIYFVDTEALGEESGPRAGSDNLYWFDGKVTHFVATLESGDNEIGGALGNSGDWRPVASYRSAEASPNGRYLAFMSRAPLTGVTSNGPCTFGSNQPVPCEEVFLYDSTTGVLSCPSCNPNGSSPLGNSALPMNDANPASIVKFFRPQPRYVTDEGRLYFDSHDSLSPSDTNGGVEDVYQYEPQNVGSCAKPGGCVALISSGREAFNSNFLAINEGTSAVKAGADVFFTTRAQLVGADKDGVVDLYDARERGGFPYASGAEPVECSGEACQPAGIAPGVPTSGSSSFQGTGNVKPPVPSACPKGKVKSKGKCVKKPKHAKKKKHKQAGKKPARTTSAKKGGAK